MKVVARLRMPDGRVMRMGLDPQPAGAGHAPRALTPPPMDLFARPAPRTGTRERRSWGPWWILKTLQESYQRFF